MIGPGQYFYIDEQTGLPRKLDVTAQDTKRWQSEGSRMLATGLTVPVPYEHDFTAHPMTPKEKLLNNAGEVAEYTIEDAPDGRKDVLFANVEIQDPAVKDKIGNSIRWTSPWISSFTDGNGNKWNNVITHLALTTRPRITKQTPFPSIAAALSLADSTDRPIEIVAPNMVLSRAGLLDEDGEPVYPVAFSLFTGVEVEEEEVEEYNILLSMTEDGETILTLSEEDDEEYQVALSLEEEQIFFDLDDDKEYEVILSILDDGTIEGIALAADRTGHLHDAIGRFTSGVKSAANMTGSAAKRVGGLLKRGGSAVARGAGKLKKRVKKLGIIGTARLGARRLGRAVSNVKRTAAHGIERAAGAVARSKVGKAVGHVAGVAAKPLDYLNKKYDEHIGDPIRKRVGKSIQDSIKRRNTAKFGKRPTTGNERRRPGAPRIPPWGPGTKPRKTLSIDAVFERACSLGIDDETALQIALAAMPPDEDEDVTGEEVVPGEESEEEAVADQEGDIEGGDVDEGSLQGASLRMEEILCHLLQALGVPMPDDSNEQEFQRHLYEAAMSKIKELTSKGLQKEENEGNQPDQNTPPDQNPNTSHANKAPNPLVQQEQQPMYMSLEEIAKLPDPLKGVALAMYKENVKLRAEADAAKKDTESLKAAKLKEATKERSGRIAILSKMSPRVKADLEAMLANPSMALSMGEGGVVVDPMAQTLAILEKGLADMPVLLTSSAAALSVNQHPTDDSEMTAEMVDKIADDFARAMGCVVPERN